MANPTFGLMRVIDAYDHVLRYHKFDTPRTGRSPVHTRLAVVRVENHTNVREAAP